MQPQRITIKVYYEDTDSLGVVYYANYLKFLERARTELIDGLGRPIQQWNAEGFNFAVFQLQITFLKPLKLGDECEVITRVVGGSVYRKKLEQHIERDGEVITEAKVDLVCLDEELQLREFPPGLLD
jgi:tol-pal system-associated acyl-CoA thioesterase